MRILMIEDEKYIAEAVAQVLKKNHYTVDLAFDGEYGLDCAESNIYDFILLDIMLPKMDGLMVLKEMRQRGVKTPVLLLTARDQIKDKLQGLDFGADDYIAKPFHSDELLARLRALGRRKTELNNDGILRLGNIEFNPHTLLVSCEKCEGKLSLKEAQLLELLLERKNMVVSKEIIIEKLWGFRSEAEDSHVETHVSLLRKKLNGVNSGITIRTIRGSGYTLNASKDGD